jgi:hypothetical protein
MPEFKMSWQQILEAARAGLASAKSGNFSSGSTLPPEQPPPQVRQIPPPQQPVPQSLFDAFQKPPVPMPRPVGGAPESLSSPEAYSGALNPGQIQPPPLPVHMPPNTEYAAPERFSQTVPTGLLPLSQRWLNDPTARRSENIEDRRGSSGHEAFLAMLDALLHGASSTAKRR